MSNRCNPAIFWARYYLRRPPPERKFGESLLQVTLCRRISSRAKREREAGSGLQARFLEVVKQILFRLQKRPSWLNELLIHTHKSRRGRSLTVRGRQITD